MRASGERVEMIHVGHFHSSTILEDGFANGFRRICCCACGEKVRLCHIPHSSYQSIPRASLSIAVKRSHFLYLVALLFLHIIEREREREKRKREERERERGERRREKREQDEPFKTHSPVLIHGTLQLRSYSYC